MPNPLLLPGQAISNAVQNAGYSRRRARVAAFVKVHHALLVQEITAGGGATLTQAMQLARVPVVEHSALIARLNADIALYRADSEALIVALMVHGV